MYFRLSMALAAAALVAAMPAHAETAAPATYEPAAGAAAPAPASPADTAKPTKKVAKKLVPKKPVIPAKQLFGAATTPAPLASRSIGFYAKGCLSGAKPLPIDGPAWQAMRLSRNRNWGHPELIAVIERLASEARQFDGWSGLLVGDLSQPRGGPMLTGHASHQVGLDADIWLTPMPDRRLTEKEREDLSATSMLATDQVSVDPKIWTPAHIQLIKRATSYHEVERVLVHPAIKQALCQAATGDRSWLGKVRPYWGHHYHFHMRIACPKGSAGCVGQPAPNGDDGCGAEVTDWLKRVAPRPQPPVAAPAKPSRPKPQLTLDQLPAECKVVLESGPKPAAPASAVAAQR